MYKNQLNTSLFSLRKAKKLEIKINQLHSQAQMGLASSTNLGLQDGKSL